MLDGSPQVPRDVAMAANLGKQFAITGFVGYKFGCMIASDTRFASRGCVFGVKLSDENIVAKIECLRVIVMARNFGNKIAINWLCVNDSDSAIGYVGGLSGWPTKCRYCRYAHTRERCYGNQFLAFDAL